MQATLHFASKNKRRRGFILRSQNSWGYLSEFWTKGTKLGTIMVPSWTPKSLSHQDSNKKAVIKFLNSCTDSCVSYNSCKSTLRLTAKSFLPKHTTACQALFVFVHFICFLHKWNCLINYFFWQKHTYYTSQKRFTICFQINVKKNFESGIFMYSPFVFFNSWFPNCLSPLFQSES